MTILEWGLQALLVLALGASLPAALRLERTLSALGKDRADLAKSAKVFTEAVSEAEDAIARLRQASDGAGRGVAQQVAAATRVGDDLRFLLERAEAQADRLDAAVRGLRAFAAAEQPRPAAEPPEVAPAPEARRQPAASPRTVVLAEPPPLTGAAVSGAATAQSPSPARIQAEQQLMRALRGEVKVS
jgi:hypothetical protein